MDIMIYLTTFAICIDLIFSIKELYDKYQSFGIHAMGCVGRVLKLYILNKSENATPELFAIYIQNYANQECK